jgi:hypothetical protein
MRGKDLFEDDDVLRVVEFGWMVVIRDLGYVRVYDTYDVEDIELRYSIPACNDMTDQVEDELADLSDDIGVSGCNVSYSRRAEWLIATVKLLQSIKLTAMQRERASLPTVTRVRF